MADDEIDELRVEMDRMFKNREHCNRSCMYYDVCPYKSLSLSKAKNEGQKKAACMLKTMPDSVKEGFRNLILSPGTDGIEKELRRTLFLLSSTIRNSEDPKSTKDYLDILLKMHKILEPKDAEEDDYNMNINIKTIQPKAITTEVAGEDVEHDYDIIDEAQRTDPESLFYDPNYERNTQETD